MPRYKGETVNDPKIDDLGLGLVKAYRKRNELNEEITCKRKELHELLGGVGKYVSRIVEILHTYEMRKRIVYKSAVAFFEELIAGKKKLMTLNELIDTGAIEINAGALEELANALGRKPGEFVRRYKSGQYDIKPTALVPLDYVIADRAELEGAAGMLSRYAKEHPEYSGEVDRILASLGISSAETAKHELVPEADTNSRTSKKKPSEKDAQLKMFA